MAPVQVPEVAMGLLLHVAAVVDRQVSRARAPDESAQPGRSEAVIGRLLRWRPMPLSVMIPTVKSGGSGC